MATGNQYVRPPCLREFLDGGGDVSGFALLDSLVEAVVVARRLLPAETNRQQAARNRRFVDRWFRRHGNEEPIAATQDLLTFALWKAECLEDAELAQRFEDRLPLDTLARALMLVDELRHVHPLAVREDLTNWTCRACGETFGHGAAVVVTNTGEDLGYEDDLSYCLGCMSIAASALEAASGIDRFTPGLDDARHGLRPGVALVASPDEVVLTEVDDDADDVDDARLLDDEETVRVEAARLTAQLEASQRRMMALEDRRAALIRRLEESGRRRAGEDAPGS